MHPHLSQSRRVHFLAKIILVSGLAIGSLALVWMKSTAGGFHPPQLVNSDRDDFDEFRRWVRDYELDPSRADLEEGVRLAVIRQKALTALLNTDPRKALLNSIDPLTYRRLPNLIKRYTEEPYSGYADLVVSVVEELDETSPLFGESRVEREVVLPDRKLKAVVYGRRESMTSKMEIPLRGIIVDGLMVVDERSLRIIKSDQYSGYEVDQHRLHETPVVGELGGELVYFRSMAESDDLQRLIEARERRMEPKVSPDFGSSKSPWTEGLKRVLMIRVDFADQPGDPVDSTGPLTLTRAQQSMDQVNAFYVSNSSGRTSLQTTVTTVLRMPQNRTFYVTSGDGPLTTHAFEAAVAAGYNPTTFDRIMYTFSAIPSSSTRAIVGGTWSIFNGSFSLYALTHELGHNYGLLHAGGWQTTDGTVIGPGSNLEYGNPFDVMGGTGLAATNFHFSALYKRQLDWLGPGSILPITSDGIYRLTMQDTDLPGGVRALRIRKNGSKSYLVEFRQLLTQYPAIMNGAVVMWDYAATPSRRTQLLDMKPQTSFNFFDAPLLIGENFLDAENKIRLTVIGKGNTNPESLDVQVELNVGCTFTFQQTSQNMPASGGGGNLAIATQPGCYPYPTSSASWLVPSFVDTSGGSTVIQHYIAAANHGGQQRIATLSLGAQSVSITQAGSATACLPVPPNLVAWWRGEGNALDERGVHSGQLRNEVTFTGGKVGGGFKFDGGPFGPPTQKVVVPDSPELAITGSLTVEGWIKINQNPSSNQFTILVRSSLLSPFPPYSIFVTQQGNIFFNIEGSPNISTRQFATAVGPPVPIGQFVHVAATLKHETGEMKVYLNGALVGQTTTTVRPYADLPSGTGTFALGIGDRADSDNVQFNGVIDELSLYNRALNLSEIQAIYNVGIASSGAAGKCLLSRSQAFDFDGDGKTDIGIFRPSAAEWWIHRSSDGNVLATQFGATTDRIVPADYTGDGRSDVAVWRPSSGEWFVLRSDDFTYYSFPFGASGDVPATADYDADGKSDATVFRPSTATWYVFRSTGGTTIETFGANGDIPVPADYDGDGKADLAIFRPSNGQWWINRSTAGLIATTFGDAAVKPVQGDYTGDGKSDVAFWRPSTGDWYVLRSEDFSFFAFAFGTTGDTPAPGDYDGDGKFDATVFRPSNATWYSNRTTAGTLIQQFGATGDRPIPNAFVP